MPAADDEDAARLQTVALDSLEQFVAALAHDVKNPLAAIKISVQGLKRGLERGDGLDPARLRDRLDRIDASVQQVLECIGAARGRLSSLSAGRQPARLEPGDLAPLLRELVDRVSRMTGQSRVRLELFCAELRGRWDLSRLNQALEAVIDNALKFSDPSSTVRVRASTSAHSIEIVVRDDGIGIPAADLPRVCQRFHRAENATGRYKGAGLGLFEAYEAIVGDHGGELEIESEEGGGCTVTVRLPVGHMDARPYG